FLFTLLLSSSFLFFFECSVDHRVLHSFPTRRSSDLVLRDVFLQIPQIQTVFVEHASVRIAHGKDFHAVFGKRERRDGPDVSESRSEEHTSELQSRSDLVCRLLLEKKKK